MQIHAEAAQTIRKRLRRSNAFSCTFSTNAVKCCAYYEKRLAKRSAVPDMEKSKATLRDVAKAAGVHISTASRALKAEPQHRITPDVVERVRTVASKLGYRVNAFASSLRTKRSNAIGILIPDLWNPGFPAIVTGVQDVVSREGYEITIASDGNELERHAAVIENMLARQVDGLILATAILKDPAIASLVSRNVPAVMVNRRDDQGRAPSVVTDDGRGIALAVEHLASLGHRHICHIAGPQNLSTGVTRKRGFLEAAKALGLKVHESQIVVADSYSREAGARAASRIITQNRQVTALVAANDLLALGCYDSFHASGIRCPADVSITGYNDMPLVDLVSPPLTTVRVDHRQMGAEAAHLLLRRIANTNAPVIDVVLRPTLVVRASTSSATSRRSSKRIS
jgi:LacI family transcriptional regulator